MTLDGMDKFLDIKPTKTKSWKVENSTRPVTSKKIEWVMKNLPSGLSEAQL